MKFMISSIYRVTCIHTGYESIITTDSEGNPHWLSEYESHGGPCRHRLNAGVFRYEHIGPIGRLFVRFEEAILERFPKE